MGNITTQPFDVESKTIGEIKDYIKHLEDIIKAKDIDLISMNKTLTKVGQQNIDKLFQRTVKKISDLKTREGIHCESIKQALSICELMHEEGFKWCSGKSYLERTNWDENAHKTCYLPHEGMFTSIDSSTIDGYTIYPARDFIK